MCVDGFYIVCFNWCTVTDKKGLMLPGKMTMKYLHSSRTLVMMKVNKNPPQGSLETERKGRPANPQHQRVEQTAPEV
jgi:hypothetical protein